MMKTMFKVILLMCVMIIAACSNYSTKQNVEKCDSVKVDTCGVDTLFIDTFLVDSIIVQDSLGRNFKVTDTLFITE